jgi:hypothetical protein
MKRTKIALGAFVLAAAVSLLFAFTSKNENFAVTTYYYRGMSVPQRIDPDNVTGQLDPRLNSLTATAITNASNWSTSASSGSPATGNFLLSISFDEEATADNGNDGQLTKQEAINAVSAKYASTSPKSLPANGMSFTEGTTSITVYRSAAVHN